MRLKDPCRERDHHRRRRAARARAPRVRRPEPGEPAALTRGVEGAARRAHPHRAAHQPFPLTFVRGEGATLTDADGHEYIDLLGDYTAGLLGHSERRVLDAVDTALRTNVSVGGIHPPEAELAD